MQHSKQNNLRMNDGQENWSYKESEEQPQSFMTVINSVIITCLAIRINQQPDSVARWQHGSQICFETFIQ